MANYTNVESLIISVEATSISDEVESIRLFEEVEVVVPDLISPVVDNFDPAIGEDLQTNQSVQFDVTDDSGEFARILVVVRFALTGQEELVHDGDSFVGYYSANSSRVIIANGYRYSVLRFGGWSEAPTIRVFPIDASGNE